jgi:hypothetical protein
MAADASGLARARDTPALVQEVCEMMASGQWVTGRSHAYLAEREGVAVSTVRNWATEASRLLRSLTSGEREELQARNSAHLEALAADAHAAGEYSAAVNARATQAKLLGLNAPERQHVTTETDQRAQYEAMAGPQRIAFLRENIAELQALLVAEEKAQGIVTGVTEYVLAGKESEGR